MPTSHLTHRAITILSMLLLAGCNSTLFKKDSTEPVTQESTPSENQISVKPPVSVATKTSVAQATSEEIKTAPKPPKDAWSRMRDGYRLDLAVDNTRVKRDIDWYRRHGEYLSRVQKRAEPYLFFILEEIEKRDMPAEFALLPVVESAFQPFAYSPGRAAGLWQFIPSTGKMYGLDQNWWYDGRRDVVSATKAALDYLKALSKEFDGDWYLAMAAYNAGAGNVRKAIRRNVKKGKPTDYWNLKLPQETMGYVPRLLAISAIMKSPDQYGVSLHTITNSQKFETIGIGSQLDLALAAEMAGITIDELYLLNPGFNRWATAPKGPHRLNIPVENASLFKEKIAALPESERLRWTRYKIKSGDSLGVIARKHNTTVALLKTTNKIRGNNIRAGKHLLIPVATKSATAYSQSAEQRLAKKQSRKGDGNKITHFVQQGDTLWDIARLYNVGHKSVARWNGIAPGDTLKLGQKLVVWSKTAVVTQNTPVIPTAAPPINSRSAIRYRVRKGDSLARIAGKFNVSVSDLRKWNRFSSKYLQPGQKIKLYVNVTEQSSL